MELRVIAEALWATIRRSGGGAPDHRPLMMGIIRGW